MARILVIDDDAPVRDTLKVMLEFEGYEALLVPNGHEGITEFQSGRFDLVICDIFMPDLSGLEVISEIRGLSATAPIIAITGGFAEAPETRFTNDVLQIARHNDATLTLAKPFRRNQLIALVQRCIE